MVADADELTERPEGLSAQDTQRIVEGLVDRGSFFEMGRDYALKNLQCPSGLTVKAANNVGDKIFIDGNSAAALGAVYGGASVCAWYPITPSSSLAESFISYCQRLRKEPETGKARYAIIQGEDELASVGIAIGAGWNGARSFMDGIFHGSAALAM